MPSLERFEGRSGSLDFGVALTLRACPNLRFLQIYQADEFDDTAAAWPSFATLPQPLDLEVGTFA